MHLKHLLKLEVSNDIQKHNHIFIGYAILGYQVFSGNLDLWTHIITDIMVVFIEIAPWPGIFWIMIVTYSQNSAVNKLLSGSPNDKSKNEEKKNESV